MSMEKIGNMYTYDTWEEIPGATVVKVDTGQVVQIPEGYIGEDRWLVVWAGLRPWESKPLATPLPPGFVDIFGHKPKPGSPPQALAGWQTDLYAFISAGPPIGTSDADLAAAEAQSIIWLMGTPHYYSNRYGSQVRFPESDVPNFQANGSTFLLTQGQIIVSYQNKATNRGIVILDLHPLAPPPLKIKQKDLQAQLNADPDEDFVIGSIFGSRR